MDTAALAAEVTAEEAVEKEWDVAQRIIVYLIYVHISTWYYSSSTIRTES